MPKVVPFPPARRRAPLRAGPIEPVRSSQILPLAQMLAPDAQAVELKRLARSATKKKWRPPIGVLAVEDNRGYYLALCTYVLSPRLGKRAFLQVDDFVVLDMHNGEAAAKALIAAVEAQAGLYDCNGVEIIVPAGRSRAVPRWSSAILARHGYSNVAVVFRKAVRENGRSARQLSPKRSRPDRPQTTRSPNDPGPS